DVALAAAPPLERVELHLRRARILEERVNDPKAAVADVLAAFSWAPDRDETREALVALAAKARAWNDGVAVDAALIDRAPTSARRVELLRRKAQVIEEQLKDGPRAFRTHLIAMMLAPDDADTTSHLWRLARVIGKYREADRAPHTEPPPAQIQAEVAVAEAVAVAGRAAPGKPVEPRVPKRAQTEPLGEADLSAIEATLGVGGSTQPPPADPV